MYSLNGSHQQSERDVVSCKLPSVLGFDNPVLRSECSFVNMNQLRILEQACILLDIAAVRQIGCQARIAFITSHYYHVASSLLNACLQTHSVRNITLIQCTDTTQIVVGLKDAKA